MEERSGKSTVLWSTYNTYIDWSFAVLNTSLPRFDMSSTVVYNTVHSTLRGILRGIIVLEAKHFKVVDVCRSARINPDHKWIEQQLQQVSITLSEEARDVDTLAIDRTIELAKQEKLSKGVVQGKEDLFLLFGQEAPQQYFYLLFIDWLIDLTVNLRRIVIAWRRLQYLAAQIHNRIACSPSPFRCEPPIGGIKVGGGLPLSLCPYAA